jgi:hypothetical protein
LENSERVENNTELTEKLAEAIHAVFCDQMKAQGYTYGPVTDERKKQHSSLRPYVELPEDEKEQNRGNARDIRNKLASTGYEIVPINQKSIPAEFTAGELETLSKKEHERWMQQKIDSGWQYAAATDKARKRHKWMVPWESLPEAEKNKDRVLVKAIPGVLAKAGYRMIKAPKKDSR